VSMLGKELLTVSSSPGLRPFGPAMMLRLAVSKILGPQTRWIRLSGSITVDYAYELTREGSHEWLMYSKSLLRFRCLSRPNWTVA
jgi:hypothetical protein